MRKNLLLMPDAPAATHVPGTDSADMKGALDALGEMGEPAPDVPATPPADPPADAPPAKPPASSQPKTPAAPPKTAAPAKTPPLAKEAAKPPEQKKEEPPKDAPKPPADQADPKTPKELRTAYEKVKSDYKSVIAERDQLKAKLAEPRQPAEDPDRKRVETELETERKRRAELEDHIRYVDYEKSSEYQEKYHQPYVRAAQDAVSQVAQLKITNSEGQERPATQQDFWSIAMIDNAGEALAKAEELFGTAAKANFVMQQRENVRRAWGAASAAKEDFRKAGAEKARQAEENMQRENARHAEEWKRLNTEAVQQNEWLRPADGDEEGNALLEKGFEEAHAVFGGMITDPQTGIKRQPTQQERVKLNSDMLNRAAAFPRVLKRNEALTARISDLEKELAQYRASEPGEGEPDGGRKVEGGDSIDQTLNEWEKAVRS